MEAPTSTHSTSTSSPSLSFLSAFGEHEWLLLQPFLSFRDLLTCWHLNRHWHDRAHSAVGLRSLLHHRFILLPHVAQCIEGDHAASFALCDWLIPKLAWMEVGLIGQSVHHPRSVPRLLCELWLEAAWQHWLYWKCPPAPLSPHRLFEASYREIELKRRDPRFPLWPPLSSSSYEQRWEAWDSHFWHNDGECRCKTESADELATMVRSERGGLQLWHANPYELSEIAAYWRVHREADGKEGEAYLEYGRRWWREINARVLWFGSHYQEEETITVGFYVGRFNPLNPDGTFDHSLHNPPSPWGSHSLTEKSTLNEAQQRLHTGQLDFLTLPIIVHENEQDQFRLYSNLTSWLSSCQPEWYGALKEAVGKKRLGGSESWLVGEGQLSGPCHLSFPSANVAYEEFERKVKEDREEVAAKRRMEREAAGPAGGAVPGGGSRGARGIGTRVLGTKPARKGSPRSNHRED